MLSQCSPIGLHPQPCMSILAPRTCQVPTIFNAALSSLSGTPLAGRVASSDGTTLASVVQSPELGPGKILTFKTCLVLTRNGFPLLSHPLKSHAG